MSASPELGPNPFTALPTLRHGRRALQVLRWAVPVLLLLFLGYRLTQLGWREIWTARPLEIEFYLILVLQFFIQPVADLLIYRNLWGAEKSLRLPVFLRKRFLNSALFEYSGEVFFYLWARRTLKLPKRALVHAIKDSNLLSAGAALVMVWLVLLALIASGSLRIPALVAGHFWRYALIGSLPLVLCAILAVAHRKMTALSRRQIGETFAIHLVRSLLVLMFEFWLWELSGALPSAALCLQFVALRLVVSRLPLLPNKDLVFVGAGIAAAGLMKVPAAPVAAVLVILAASDLLLGCVLAGAPWALAHFSIARKADEAVT